MTKFTGIGGKLDGLFPRQYAESWDNVGWMVRTANDPVTGVLVSVDVTEPVLNHAGQANCNLIVAHHPLLFEPLEQVRSDRPVDRCVIEAVKNGIGIYTAHTNADSMPGGLNDVFAEKLGLEETEPIEPDGEDENAGLGRIGTLTSETTVEGICAVLKNDLEQEFIRVVGPGDRDVKTVGICTGSGGDFISPELADRVDVYITADVGHHDVLEAQGLDCPLIMLDHYEMETVFLSLATDLIESVVKDSVPVQSYRRTNPYWDPAR